MTNIEQLKQKQLSLILKYNPMLDDYHTGIRTINDILTFQEAYNQALTEKEKYEYDELSSWPDETNELLDEALRTGNIVIYSSKPIKNGTFVTPSYMQAEEYAGGGHVYSKKVPVTNVAWIDVEEGQYADTKLKEGKRIFFNDTQIQFIKEAKEKFPIDTNKVLLVKKYLDKGFKRGSMEGIGDDGYPKEMKIVAMLSPNGTILRNMGAKQLFYLLQDRFKDIFANKNQRDSFLKQVMNDWYEKRISKNGVLSKNYC